MSTASHRLRYAGPWFSAASGLPLEGRLGSPRRLTRLLLAAAARPWRAIALIGLLLRSPKVDVVLSESAAGQLVREHLNERSLGVFPRNRLCRGVLILPQQGSDYLRGRRRRAARTNLRRAAAAGIRCETVGCPSDALRAARQIVRRRQVPTAAEDLATLTCAWQMLFDQPEVTLLIARDRASCPLAVAAVVIDDEVCLIHAAVARSHDARWALHHHLVLTLIARRVKYLLTTDGGPFGALGFPPEVQHFQHLHGYDLCHIIPRSVRGQGATHQSDKRFIRACRRWRVPAAEPRTERSRQRSR